MHHRHHVVLDPVTVTGVLTAHNHLGAHGIGIASGEGVSTVGLLKAAPHPMDCHLPQLGSQGLVNLLIGDASHRGLEVGAYHEGALYALSVFTRITGLLPDAAALIATEIRFPGVAIFIGGPESRSAVAA